jgi:uncharacterized protein (DUF2384 family)
MLPRAGGVEARPETMEEQKKPVSLLGTPVSQDCCNDTHLLAELKHLVKLKIKNRAMRPVIV